MPYNTRRKSLSLPALGIHLPASSRAHRPSVAKSSSSSSTIATTTTTTTTTTTEGAQPPPSKRVKRSHTSDTLPPASSPSSQRPSSAASGKTVTFAERLGSSGRNAYEHTPPPSPGPESESKIDLEAVNDDIVAGVIEQLEKTGNRPHLIKELSTILSTTNSSVAGSANPAALLSSRLASYMRRPTFDASNPCPIAKELIPVHPRKVFYYLTTSQRQELPPDSADILTPLSATFQLPRLIAKPLSPKRIISPSLSNASVDESAENERHTRDRRMMSPSPELELAMDLGSHSDPSAAADFPTPPTPATSGYNSQRASISDEQSLGNNSGRRDLGLNSRAKSPPLEGDEQEFTATARGIRYRGMSLDESSAALPANLMVSSNVASVAPAALHSDETEEEKASKNREAVAALFGTQHGGQHAQLGMMSSPEMRPKSSSAAATVQLSQTTNTSGRDNGSKDVAMDEDLGSSILGESAFSVGMPSGWETMALGRCELVGLDELDEMFCEY